MKTACDSSRQIRHNGWQTGVEYVGVNGAELTKLFASRKTPTRKIFYDRFSFLALNRLYVKGRNRSLIMFVYKMSSGLSSTAMYLSNFRCEFCHLKCHGAASGSTTTLPSLASLHSCVCCCFFLLICNFITANDQNKVFELFCN